ncbi:stAR-related lipid transfer protein 6-like [Anneissia japonica]|uniref:stAR-related lipid transfer protein 6-like n=1 Tax=Anneissia japonica TaxID=1529436 RepID=UPI00142552B6|nr:stAR-related lipid transfer protein 6-like [Anneissia japonica]
MDYKAEAEHAYEELVKMIERDWGKEIKSSKDHKVYRMKSELFNGYAYKCEYTVEMSLSDYLALVSPKCFGGYIEDVDSIVKAVQCLLEVSDDIKILKSVSNSLAMGLISSREFIDILYIKRFADNENKVAFVVCEAKYDAPVDPKIVRSKHYPSGSLINVIEQGGKKILEIKQIEHLDFSGKVPTSVLDSFVPGELFSRGNTLKKNLKKLEKIRSK